MYYKKPVIVPPVGGVTELIAHGVHGYQVDSRNIQTLVRRIRQMAESKDLYEVMSDAAYRRACSFKSSHFSKEILSVFNPFLHPEMGQAQRGFLLPMGSN